MAGKRKFALTLAAVGLLIGTAVPAGAVGRSNIELAGVSLWAGALDMSGLDEVEVAVVGNLWNEFVRGLPNQAACLLAQPPTIVADANMQPRAAYAPSTATLYVKPGDMPRLVIFHELAHHLDFACGAADEIGADFRVAQGISASKPWWKDGRPVTWPAEYFANAIAISLGEQSRHGVTDGAVEVVAIWTGQRQPPPPPEPPLTLDDGGAVAPRIF